MSRRLAAATAALACAALIAACGGDEERDPPSQPPAELLATAAANPPASGEARILLEAQLEGSSALAGTVAVDASGPFALDEAGGLPSFDFTTDAEVAGFGVDADLVSTGDDAFIVFFGENYRVGPELTAQIEDTLAAGTDQAGGLGIDLAGWVTDPVYAGSEDVAGTETVRIEGTLDPPRPARTSPPSDGPSARRRCSTRSPPAPSLAPSPPGSPTTTRPSAACRSISPLRCRPGSPSRRPASPAGSSRWSSRSPTSARRSRSSPPRAEASSRSIT